MWWGERLGLPGADAAVLPSESSVEQERYRAVAASQPRISSPPLQDKLVAIAWVESLARYLLHLLKRLKKAVCS